MDESSRIIKQINKGQNLDIKQDLSEKSLSQAPLSPQNFGESFGICDKKVNIENQDIINEAMKFQDHLNSEKRKPKIPSFALCDHTDPSSLNQAAPAAQSPSQEIKSEEKGPVPHE